MTYEKRLRQRNPHTVAAERDSLMTEAIKDSEGVKAINPNLKNKAHQIRTGKKNS